MFIAVFQPVYLIPGSSPIHPLILLTYSPNPVIPRSFFPPSTQRFYPFISQSCYLSLTSIAPFSPCPPLLHPSSFSVSPPLSAIITTTTSVHSLYLSFPTSLHPSGPSSSQTQQMSECLASGLFFFLFSPCRVQSLPYENAAQGTALSSLQIKRLLTIQCWKVTELSQEEKGAMQRNVQVEV